MFIMGGMANSMILQTIRLARLIVRGLPYHSLLHCRTILILFFLRQLAFLTFEA